MQSNIPALLRFRTECPLCEKYYNALGCHINRAHKMSAAEFKKKMGWNSFDVLYSQSSWMKYKHLKAAEQYMISSDSAKENGKETLMMSSVINFDDPRVLQDMFVALQFLGEQIAILGRACSDLATRNKK